MCGGDVQNKNGWRKQVNITFRLPLLDREIKILISRITALAFSQGSLFVDYDIRLFEELESLVTATFYTQQTNALCLIIFHLIPTWPRHFSSNDLIKLSKAIQEGQWYCDPIVIRRLVKDFILCSSRRIQLETEFHCRNRQCSNYKVCDVDSWCSAIPRIKPTGNKHDESDHTRSSKLYSRYPWWRTQIRWYFFESMVFDNVLSCRLHCWNACFLIQISRISVLITGGRLSHSVAYQYRPFTC